MGGTLTDVTSLGYKWTRRLAILAYLFDCTQPRLTVLGKTLCRRGHIPLPTCTPVVGVGGILPPDDGNAAASREHCRQIILFVLNFSLVSSPTRNQMCSLLTDTLDPRWATRSLIVQYIMAQDENEILFDSTLLQVAKKGGGISPRFFLDMIRDRLYATLVRMLQEVNLMCNVKKV